MTMKPSSRSGIYGASWETLHGACCFPYLHLLLISHTCLLCGHICCGMLAGSKHEPACCLRYRYFAFYWWSLEWWGGMCYAVGVVGYNLAAISAMIYDCKTIDADTYVSDSVAIHSADAASPTSHCP